MALGFVLGVLASLAFVLSGNVVAYAASFVAGLATAWLVRDRWHGLGGLAGGIIASYVVWGAQEVIEQINRCGDSCGGLRSPSLTAWIAFGFGLIGLALAVGGYVAGRATRRLVGRTARSQPV